MSLEAQPNIAETARWAWSTPVDARAGPSMQSPAAKMPGCEVANSASTSICPPRVSVTPAASSPRDVPLERGTRPRQARYSCVRAKTPRRRPATPPLGTSGRLVRSFFGPERVSGVEADYPLLAAQLLGRGDPIDQGLAALRQVAHYAELVGGLQRVYGESVAPPTPKPRARTRRTQPSHSATPQKPRASASS